MEIRQVKIFVRNDKKYLLLKKIKDIHKDHVDGWEVPGGKIKINENIIGAAIREIKEETGLNVKIIKELKTLKLGKENVKTITYVFLAESENNKIKLSNEHSDYIWIKYEDIDKLNNVIYKELLKEYMLEADKY